MQENNIMTYAIGGGGGATGRLACNRSSMRTKSLRKWLEGERGTELDTHLSIEVLHSESLEKQLCLELKKHKHHLNHITSAWGTYNL